MTDDEDPDEAPIIDEEKIGELRGLLGDGEEGVDGLITTFVDRIPQVLDDLRDTAGSGDSEQMGRLAHKVKGEAATLGAKRLSLKAKAIELAAKDDDLENPQQAVEDLIATYEETEAAFDAG